MKLGFSFTTNQQNNLFDICSHLLSDLKIKYTKLHLKNLLNSHLASLSLLAIKDTLSEYGIESGAVRKGKYSYLDFEVPFICSIQQEDWSAASFTIVTNTSEDTIEYLDPLTKKTINITLKRFEAMDKGVRNSFNYA